MARVYKQPGSDKWYSDFNDPSHPKADKSGRVRVPLDTDKEIAQEELGRLLSAARSTELGRPVENISWTGFKERFLHSISTKNRVTISQYKRAIANLEASFEPPLKTLSQVTPASFDSARVGWVNSGRGLYVRNREIQSIKAMMRIAEAWKLIEKQDWSMVKKDKEPKGRLLWWTWEECEKQLFPGCPGVWKVPPKLGVRAGFRPSESYWLPWEHVDFQRERLHIAPVYEGKRLLWAPKDYERRWIPMPPDLSEDMAVRYKRRQGRFVLQENKERFTLPSMCSYSGRLIKASGLKGSLYTARHTYGSHLASGGAPAKYIKEVMGHAKLEMTDRYMHLAPEVQQQGIAKYLPN